MKKFYEKPNVEFLSFRLLEAVADLTTSGAGIGETGGSDDGFSDPGYRFSDGPGL